MADDIVIRAEGLGKKYLIGHEAERERYVALRDVIARGARNAWRMAADMARGRIVVPGDAVEEFWALRDVSFEVRRGEVLGIIGRNGAGKSTLLKVLSRITEPTEGRVTIKGRVASLLEVGTGFHPELTGRENIFLNGAILGMTRSEIKRKFDEIVAFAEVEKFLDTPVKRYSSGMYVRLAFAVAAHLEPEILIVDEVLSVGDAEFQKKSLGKMQDVAGHGRTVLFVSHNMGAVSRLCRQVLLLQAGRVTGLYKSAESGVSAYLLSMKGAARQEGKIDPKWSKNGYFIPLAFSAESGGPNPSTSGIVIKTSGVLARNDPALLIAVGIYSSDGTLLFWTTHRDLQSATWMEIDPGPVELSFSLPIDVLNEGQYYAQLCLMLHNRTYLIPEGAGPQAHFAVPPKAAPTEFWDQRRNGYLCPVLPWKWTQLNGSAPGTSDESALQEV